MTYPRTAASCPAASACCPPGKPRAEKNSIVDPVCEVRIGAENGRILRILCNGLDASAGEIAELYKRRWAIVFKIRDKPISAFFMEDLFPPRQSETIRLAHPLT